MVVYLVFHLLSLETGSVIVNHLHLLSKCVYDFEYSYIFTLSIPI